MMELWDKFQQGIQDPNASTSMGPNAFALMNQMVHDAMSTDTTGTDYSRAATWTSLPKRGLASMCSSGRCLQHF